MSRSRLQETCSAPELFLAYPEWILRCKWNFLISFGCFILFFLYWFLVENQLLDTFLMVTFKVMLVRIQEDCDNPGVYQKNRNCRYSTSNFLA